MDGFICLIVCLQIMWGWILISRFVQWWFFLTQGPSRKEGNGVDGESWIKSPVQLLYHSSTTIPLLLWKQNNCPRKILQLTILPQSNFSVNGEEGKQSWAEEGDKSSLNSSNWKILIFVSCTCFHILRFTDLHNMYTKQNYFYYLNKEVSLLRDPCFTWTNVCGGEQALNDNRP